MKVNNNNRYYCHQRIKSCCRYSAKKQTIYIFFDQNVNENRYIHHLQKAYGYAVQLTIR